MIIKLIRDYYIDSIAILNTNICITQQHYQQIVIKIILSRSVQHHNNKRRDT